MRQADSAEERMSAPERIKHRFFCLSNILRTQDRREERNSFPCDTDAERMFLLGPDACKNILSGSGTGRHLRHSNFSLGAHSTDACRRNNCYQAHGAPTDLLRRLTGKEE